MGASPRLSAASRFCRLSTFAGTLLAVLSGCGFWRDEPPQVVSFIPPGDVLPPPKDPNREVRAIYLWNVLPVIMNPESVDEFLKICTENRIDLVYCCIGQWGGEQPVLDTYDLEYAKFIWRCAREGITVWAVSGDPDWIYSFRRPKIKSVIQSYLDFNSRRRLRGEPEFSRLSLDVEPYILSDWKHDTDRMMQYYLAFLEYSSNLAGGLKTLDVAVPYSYDEHIMPESLKSFMAEVSQMAASMTLMAYITRQPALDNKVISILDDPDIQCRVYVAFETNDTGEKRVSYYNTQRNKFMEILESCAGKYRRDPNFGGMVIHDYGGFIRLKQ